MVHICTVHLTPQRQPSRLCLCLPSVQTEVSKLPGYTCSFNGVQQLADIVHHNYLMKQAVWIYLKTPSTLTY
jgi:hypothetical protein